MLALVKTSAACLLMMIYMICFYFRKPHVPVRSAKIFQWLIVAALFDSSFDFITICTVNHRDVVDDSINLVVHIIYLLSISSFIYLLFLYMRSYLEVNIKFSKAVRILHNLPFTLSAVGILILPITYVHGETTDYSLGPKAYALYGSLVIYLIWILYYCLRYWKILDGDKRMAIILAVPLFVATAVIQMVIPETLIVVVCSTMILLGLILSNENTDKYIDEKTSLFNQYSFEKVLDEYDFDRQKPLIGVLCLCRTENRMDWKQDALILHDIYREMKQYRLHGYRVSETGVAFIGSTEEKASAMLDKMKNSMECKYGKEAISIETTLFTEDVNTTKYHCMRNIIVFCTETGSRFAYVDYLTNIYNRNALERDLANLQEEGQIYYFMADLNDLKIVNDTIGHSAGDKMLQGFARMLVDAAGEDGRAYRQGGDEFAVLYGKDAQQFLHNLKELCREYNRSYTVQISYAIGYCQIADQEFRDVADQMMYEDKRRIKQSHHTDTGISI